MQINIFDKTCDLNKVSTNQSSWFSDAIKKLGVEEHSGWPDYFGKALRHWNSIFLKEDITVISLFSGGGGLDIGFHDAGFKIIECIEMEHEFAATLQKNTSVGMHLEGSKIICQDIYDYNPSVNHVDFIIGGPPCQTFSAASARAAGVNGIDDARGNLFLQYARLLEKLQPKGFLFENVYRIVGAQSGKPWKKIQETFKNLGYTLYWRILDAADYGVPQFRERLIIIGIKKGSFLFPLPSHGPDSPDGHNYYSASQAVSDLDTAHCKIGIGGRHGKLLNDIPPGLNYSFYTEHMGHPNAIFGWRSKFSDYLYKADPNTPVRTIKAQGGQYTGPFSWENRPFTIEEYKRLQTFPDDYIICGSRQKIIHQLGNSVPPQLARILALTILNQLFDVKIPFSISLMNENYELGFRKRKNQLTSIYAKKAELALKNHSSKQNIFYENEKGIEFFSVDQNFQIRTGLKEENAFYKAVFIINKNDWVIEISDINEKNYNYYKIEILTPLENINQLKTVLISKSNTNNSLLALWKIYEILVKKYLFKDDLVQMFGYYQYKLTYSLKMDILENSLSENLFWQTVKKITSGNGVGVIRPFSELAILYGLSDEKFISYLKDLKIIGYEIRNHYTNNQIPKGFVLIPYSFPTLNERSLQRLTRLS